ncbi:hypothetical protein [Natranaeroarchaeum sulfidigenes]|uniref:RHH-fold DNA-binding protein n=1 Tax=Natranaeroarchaeum sulfidigenes TaxID=2784880 RepID=A0A897MQQ9_9EURY|nr:hypothetical protein [Natranaeroarchaeum sulfidigenes]QSG02914.1 RHH-fold DNA-binding protein [Natranaeroarchaeum sulfidigenes]
MSTSDDPGRVQFQSPEYIVNRLDAIADLFGKDRTDLLVEALSDTIDQINKYRSQFDGDNPGQVSLVEASEDMATEDVWGHFPIGKCSNAEQPSLTQSGVTTQP